MVDQSRGGGDDPDDEEHDRGHGDHTPPASVRMPRRRRWLPRTEGGGRGLRRVGWRCSGGRGRRGLHARLRVRTVAAGGAHQPPYPLRERALVLDSFPTLIASSRLALGTASLALAGSLLIGERIAPILHR